jgi:hypothetical protein
VPERDDTTFVVEDEVVDERRTAPAAVRLALIVFVALVVVLLSASSHSSSSNSTRPRVARVPGRTVGDDRSLAETYAGNRVLRGLKANGVGAHGARLDSSCTSTNPHDLGGGQSWDCDVRADAGVGGSTQFVVHVREDARGAYAGQLDRGG